MRQTRATRQIRTTRQHCIHQNPRNAPNAPGGHGMKQPQNVIFWGAGATAALGIRTTDGQTKFIRRITGADELDKPLPVKERIAKALAPNGVEPWISALSDLITILGDRNDNYRSIDSINDEERDAMRRNWPETNDEYMEGD